MANADSMPPGRVCTGCDTFKNWECFCKAARGRYGRNSKCRDCMARYQRDNKDRVNALSLARYHRLAAPGKLVKAEAKRAMLAMTTKRCAKCMAEKNKSQFGVSNDRPDGLRPYCMDCKAQESRQYRERHPDVSRRSSRDWLARHPERVAVRNKRYREKPANRIHQAISSRIYAALKGKGGRKSSALLGYTFEELANHLERQFLSGMTWQNYGKWHIDHIVPLSSFTITGPDDPEIARAWGLPNLRPLWSIDNFRKNAKVTHLI